MNLKQAIDASPYRAAQCEASNGRTFYVEPDESDEENLEAFDLKVAHGAMPAEVVGSYNGLASLIAALALDGGEPQEDSHWLPTGEEGEPIEAVGGSTAHERGERDMRTQWTVYANEQNSDQTYGPYARWEYTSRQMDPRTEYGNVEREVYTVILEDAPVGYESKYRETIEAALAADRCVEFWQLAD